MKRTKTIVNRIVVAVMTALLSIALLPGFKAEAVSDMRDISSATIDLNHKGSLNVIHIDADDELAPNVTSHLYKVASIDQYGLYTIEDDFSGFFEDQDFFNNGYVYDEWKDCVQHTNAGGSNTGAMERYIDANDIQEVTSGVSDANGETLYSNLDLGIYFVRSEEYVKGEYTHAFINFVYPVPILEKPEAGGNLVINYNPSASPKKAKIKNDVMVHCKLLKRWEDSGYEINRPSSVTFNIYSDGTLMETVTLSSDNNWYFEWEQEGLHTYTVEEVDSGAGYTGSFVVTENNHDFEFVCTNTYIVPENPPVNPPEIPPTTPETPVIPEEPDTPGEPDTPDEPDIPVIPEVLGAIRNIPQVLGAVRELPAVLGARRLPQTGQLWWPLPILVIVGVLMIVKGIKKNKENKA
jgi:hypothetical protein